MLRNHYILMGTAGTMLALFLVNPLSAQVIRPASGSGEAQYPGVNRLEIFNGANRTVRYHGNSISPGEESTLRELERVENETAYVNNLQALKQQYVSGERFMDVYRRNIQIQLYGLEKSSTTTAGLGLGYAGSYYRPFVGAYRSYYPAAWAGGPLVNYGGLTRTFTQTASLADGMGPEGAIKDAVARVVAEQATPEYASNQDRAYDRAMLRASVSPTLRAALNLPSTEDGLREQGKIRSAAAAMPSTGVTLTLRDGEVITGLRYREDRDWYIIDLPGGSTTRIRPSEVLRINESSSKPGGIKPAID